jgi:polysaccharide biosynthesis/export protein
MPSSTLSRLLGVPSRRARRAVCTALVALTAACGATGKYVWVDDLPPTHGPEGAYVLGPGDMINIRVYNQEGMSTHGRIRSDGKISLPFLNDVQAAGYTPSALAQQLQTRLKEYVNLPVVTVAVDEARPLSISVLGLVPRQGVYQVEPGTHLGQILALAGGLTDFAHKDRIFVVRNPAAPFRIRFSYDALVRAEGRAAQFVLQAGDVVVVE